MRLNKIARTRVAVLVTAPYSADPRTRSGATGENDAPSPTPTHRAIVAFLVRVLFVMSPLVFGFAAQASSDTTYTYTGKPFTNPNPPLQGFLGCPPVCRITGSFTMAEPLPANLVTGTLPDGQISPKSYSFTDGVTVFTNKNVDPLTLNTHLYVTTDATGKISSWFISLSLPTPADGSCICIATWNRGILIEDFTSNGDNHAFAYNQNSPGSWVAELLSPPTNLHTKQSGTIGNQILLTWDYGSDPIDGFNVYRKKPSDTTWSPTPIATIPVGLAPYGTSDTVPLQYGTYAYRVTAYKGANESDPSNEDTAFQIFYGSDQCSRDPLGVTHCTGITTPLPPGGRGGNKIIASFTPDDTMTLKQVAQNLGGFDHFNWVSLITHDVVTLLDISAQPLPLPHYDPPLGGYLFPPPTGPEPADYFPYYFEETPNPPAFYYIFSNEAGGNQSVSDRAVFFDLPGDPAIAYTTGDYISFFTTLVGVRAGVGVNPSHSEDLVGFAWDTTYTGSWGGVGRRSNGTAPDDPGTGGVFNIRLVPKQDFPQNVRIALLQAGVQGIPTNPKVDKDAPMTASFLSGPQSGGWYTGPVMITLIATDIDGPADIAGTSYNVDGGPLSSYTAPFGVFGDGTHTMQFRSVDKAGNAEGPHSITFRIDQTPPHMIGLRSPDPNVFDWNNSAVTITFQCSDALSGLAAGSPPAPTVVSTQGAGQSVKGTCTDLAGNSASLTVPDINIDTTPPVLNAVPVPTPNANGWNNTSVTVTFVASDALSGVATVSSPVTLSNEGAGQIVTGMATDKAGNTSTIRIVLNIDLTPPEAYLQFDAVAQDVVLFGRDLLSGVKPGPVPPQSVVPVRRASDEDEGDFHDDDDAVTQLRTYQVIDLAGNSLTLVLKVSKNGHQIRTQVVSLQYGQGTVTTLPRNSQSVDWDLDDGRVTELEQNFRAGPSAEAPRVKADFDLERNQTTITVQEPEPRQRTVRAGLVLLRLATTGGRLSIEY